ncbi:MAG TPA: M20/M25/M40 family metallo-hydrolase, partial [Candidatus Polarisedimenticolaceae bacterium]|nr:M20/M25/M40 family metallo-hydrolase [Candidatus Polarisedimenticolaceae bacterium]
MSTPSSQSLSAKLESRLAELVHVRTLASRPKINKGELERIASNLQRAGMSCRISQNKGYPHLYAHFQPVDKTEVWLSAHLDVVGGTESQFNLKKEKGMLFGRGVYDMKFAIPVYEFLAEYFAKDRPPIGIIITTDEEVSGLYGSSYLAHKLKLKAKTIILPDGGGPWMIERSAKGAQWVHLEAFGTAAHAARPHQGVNAIELVVQAVLDIRLAVAAGHGDKPTDTTVNFGKISGGEATNQVPASAHADIDIRFSAPHALEDIKAKVRGIQASNPKVTIAFGPEAEAHSANTLHPDTRLLHTIMQGCIGKTVKYVDSTGGSEARYYAAAGAHPIVFYPGGGGIHTGKEFL